MLSELRFANAIENNLNYHMKFIHGIFKAISCHYANAEKCYYINVNDSTQQIIAQEVNEIVKKRLGEEAELNFEVISNKSYF